ncbi:hypothetical protein AX16_010027 [Volvariella volvacea WC 439]|nr:hypothetical protein AX16_010027 [Volvariella volvacea WC 439]
MSFNVASIILPSTPTIGRTLSSFNSIWVVFVPSSNPTGNAFQRGYALTRAYETSNRPHNRSVGTQSSLLIAASDVTRPHRHLHYTDCATMPSERRCLKSSWYREITPPPVIPRAIPLPDDSPSTVPHHPPQNRRRFCLGWRVSDGPAGNDVYHLAALSLEPFTTLQVFTPSHHIGTIHIFQQCDAAQVFRALREWCRSQISIQDYAQLRPDLQRVVRGNVIGNTMHSYTRALLFDSFIAGFSIPPMHDVQPMGIHLFAPYTTVYQFYPNPSAEYDWHIQLAYVACLAIGLQLLMISVLHAQLMDFHTPGTSVM